ncbi:MAG: DUF4468 domain-containing protein [Candidatus Pedobacter colombiensis]|uniref:DUF4468 domain-containing protein n=1 Tax=Candidatus Pedobacter colombiensis TaxID=3121371 RepID=A0AAJ5WAB0_9SPHI|nr:DUF4468 domain-containing protein [Pedobacter sp.]WEK20233.1 MAG: DUF4468 domain-containing protein [Pedobacter sp.]
MKFLTLAVLLFFTIVGFAQDKPLSNDDRGKLIYYEVVTIKDVPKDSLSARAALFFKKSTKSLKVKSEEGDSVFQAAGKLIINKTALVLSHPSGEVFYNFHVEIRAGKYRFWLTDFNFISYQRDRYGNFVPSTTVGTPLETKPGKLNAAEWGGYLKATTREVNVVAERFKVAMMSKAVVSPVVKAAPVSPVKQKW